MDQPYTYKYIFYFCVVVSNWTNVYTNVSYIENCLHSKLQHAISRSLKQISVNWKWEFVFFFSAIKSKQENNDDEKFLM